MLLHPQKSVEVDMRRWISASVVLFALICLLPQGLLAQSGDSGASEIGFKVEPIEFESLQASTRIPFVLDRSLYENGTSPVVTIQIFNLLQEFVASPLAVQPLQGDTLPAVELEYQIPGRYEVLWDGRDFAGVEVASGVYFVNITVNGLSRVVRMLVGH